MILKFRQNDDEFHISEPAAAGWLGRKFSSEDERGLVQLFQDLLTAITSQCAERRWQAEQRRDQIREQISRRLLFGQPEKVRAKRGYRTLTATELD